MQPTDDNKANNVPSPLIAVNPAIRKMVLATVILVPLSYYLGFTQPEIANKIDWTISHMLLPEIHDRKTLRCDYEQIFATPFEKVAVSEYTNAKAGHGTLFSMSLKSSCALQLQESESYETVPFDSPKAVCGSHASPDWFAKNHAPWIVLCLYKQKPAPVIVSYNHSRYELKSGQLTNPDPTPTQIWVYLNQARDRCDVFAHE